MVSTCEGWILQQHIDLQEGITIAGYLQSAFSNLYAIEYEMLKIAEEMAEAVEVEKLLVRYGELQTILKTLISIKFIQKLKKWQLV